MSDDGLIDISILVDPATPVWPGDTPFSCKWTWEIARGDSVNVSCISGSPHVGTHADAPVHVDAVWAGSESLALGQFLGPVTILDVTARSGALERADVGPLTTPRLILKTGQTIAGGAFPDEWPWLSTECVAALAREGLQLVGVDSPSVDARRSVTLDTHRAIFLAGAVVLENLDLRQVPAGVYELVAAPLSVKGLDAAPVRAALKPLAK